MKQYVLTDQNGYFNGIKITNIEDNGPNTHDIEAPNIPLGMVARLEENAWVLEDDPYYTNRMIAAHDKEKAQLISEADSLIRTLSEEREAGIISNDDLERWKSWITYRKELRELKIATTDIEWPTKPE